MDFPFEADCETWIAALTEVELFHAADSYTPARGDLVFADTDEDGSADHAAIVTGVSHDEAENQDQLTVIEGDADNAVKETTCELHNPLIIGYAVLPENPQLHNSEPEMLTFTGTANRVEVTVLYEKGAFPDGTEMHLETIWKKDVIDAISETVKEDNKEVVRVQAVDITFVDPEGNEVYPSRPIQVTMKSLAVPEKATEKPSVVHVDNDMNTSVVDAAVPADEPMGSKEAVTFEAETFSVYAIVYTVDFSYEVNGKVYGFTMQGADTVSLRALIEALHVYEKESEEIDIANEDLPEEVTASEDSPLDKFMAEIENVTFSDTSLLVPAYVEEDATAGEIKTELKLFPTYPLGLTQSEVLELNAKEYKEGDWILISMKQFDTTETLTVFMKNGNEFYITVTDAQDQPEDSEGNVITIANPAGTTIDLFDYWVIRQDIIGRDAWGDLNQNWGGHDDNQGLNGTGNNKGINSSTGDAEHGHALKFSPAWEGTVFNGTKNNWTSLNTNGRDGLNSYTGNGNPFYIEDGKQKYDIVQGTLSDGFPILTENTTIGTNGESLAYLFDPRVSHEGKASYPGVNQLLYVDKDGYYTYDSRDYKADFNSDEKTFNVTKQTDDNTEIRGFWPFGTQNFWLGMHVNTQFSMPANGEVLNPYNEYKPMQFEFSGDDDTWLYVDGVLVGDGGGIHNRTEIDINFKNGTVTLTGKKDANHPGDFESVKYLDDIFKAAGKYPEQGSEEEAENWEDIPGVEGHKRFKAGTYHTFDMFYLERGGGESNLYIHYNLVSTADFTAHKTFHGRDEDDLLKRDEFQFELIGLDGKYRSVKNQETGAYELIPATGEGAASARAIMPKTAGTGGDGTVASPFYDPDTQTLVNGQPIHSQTYRTGVTEDGNVNFGTAEISQEDMNEADQGNPPVYKYLVREVVPDDAVNANGITWGAATEEQKKAGGFVKNNIIYDGTVYYMSGRVTSWTETDATGQEVTRHGIAKTYYTDDTYTTVRENTPFISFVNTYNSPHGNVDFTKIDQNKQVLAGATFQLFRDSECTKPAKVIDEDNRPWTATSDANGRVSFEHVRVGTYYMKETAAPANHALDETVYKVVIEDETDPTKYSRISILGDPQETNVTEIINTEPGKLSIVKEWLDSSGRPEAGGNKTANVHLYKKLDPSSAAQTTKVTVVYHREGASWDLQTETGNAVVVENASSFDILWHLGNDASHQLSNMTVNGILYENAQDTTVDCGNGKVTWTPWNGSSSVLHVADLKGNLYIEFTSNCDWFSTKPYIQNKEQYVPPEIDTEPHLVDTIALNSGNSWTASKTIGGTDANHQEYDLPAVDDKGYRYLYYIVELDDSENEISIGNTATGNYKLIGYSPNNSVGVANQGVLTVHNKADGPKTINIVVRKTDDNAKAEQPNYLEGAVFKLEYRTDDSKEYTGISNEVVTELDTNSQFTVPEDGITLTGLVDGQYRLKEVQAPEDYIFTVDYPVTFTVSDGVITGTTGTIEKVAYKPATGTGNAEFIIPNEQGVALPRTGGPGTSHFSAFGGILILAAGVLLLRRKHRI